MRDSLLGTWRLVSCHHDLSDGRVTYPFGKKPKGRLVYTADGHMIVMLMDPNRPSCRSNGIFEAKDSELAASMRGFLAYSGRWEARGGEVIHHVDLSLFPNWVGTRQIRRFVLSRNKVKFSTRPFVSEGILQTAHLTWERVPKKQMLK